MIYIVSRQTEVFDTKFTKVSVEEALRLLGPLNVIGLDTETTGFDCHTKKLLLLQMGCQDFQIVFDIASFEGVIPLKVKEFLREKKRTYIIQNAKFDLKFLYKQEVVLHKVYDTFLAEQIITHGLISEGRSLDKLVSKYYSDSPGLDKSIRDQFIGGKIDTKGIIYAAMDVVYLEGIARKQLDIAKKLDLVACINLDNSFVKVLAYIEFCGIKLDWEKWAKRTEENIQKTRDRLTILNQWVIDNVPEYNTGMHDLFSDYIDVNINWNSQQQVIPLFEKLGINCTLKEKGMEKKSLDAKKVLALQKKDFPIIPLYLDYKESVTQIHTFGLNWKDYINSSTGRIHTVYRQIQNTGRLASGERPNKQTGFEGAPNMQNLPSDQETRSCFIAGNGNKMASLDYSSQEQRVLANFSQVETLLNFYKNGFTDMHSYVAFLMFPDIRTCEVEDITNDVLKDIKKNHPHERNLAKNGGFAINYGGDGHTISKNCGISKEQGKFVYDSYFRAFSGLKEYFNSKFDETVRQGYILFNGVTKRKYFYTHSDPVLSYYRDKRNSKGYVYQSDDCKFKEAEMRKLCQNYPIQGSSADMVKLACIYFFGIIIQKDWLWRVKIVNTVHDEIIIESPENIMEEAAKLLEDCMEKAGDVFCKTIPLVAEPAIGDFWIH